MPRKIHNKTTSPKRKSRKSPTRKSVRLSKRKSVRLSKRKSVRLSKRKSSSRKSVRPHQRHWTEHQQHIITQVSGKNVNIFHVNDSELDAFTWGLENNSTIKSLSVDIDAKAIIMPAILKIIRQSRSLVDIRITSSSSINITALSEAFRQNNTIKRLEIFSHSSKKGINAGMVEFSNMIAENTGLRELGISCKLTVEDIENLSLALRENNTLQEIDLSNVTGKGAIALVDALKINTSIRSVDLSYNKIGDEGAIALADALKINKSIRSLNLSQHNHITDVGARALLDALKINTSIVTLDLSYNKINKMKSLLKADPRIRFTI